MKSGNLPAGLGIAVLGLAVWTSARDYAGDSLAVRQLLDLNGLSSIRVEEVSAVRDGRILAVNLAQKGISVVPPSIGTLSELIQLDLTGNAIESLPDEFGNLTKLQQLRLQGNRLSSVPTSFGSLDSLVRLDLSDNNFSVFPVPLCGCATLYELRLSNNTLTTLPPEIGNLSKLSRLYLDNNTIESLPPEMGLLSCLTFLELGNNALELLPDEFCDMIRLTAVHLNENRLWYLPGAIGDLGALEFLRLERNNLRELPSSLCEIGTLRVLQLEYNNLSDLPGCIVTMTATASLNVRYNYLCNLGADSKAYLSSYDAGWESTQACSAPPPEPPASVSAAVEQDRQQDSGGDTGADTSAGVEQRTPAQIALTEDSLALIELLIACGLYQVGVDEVVCGTDSGGITGVDLSGRGMTDFKCPPEAGEELDNLDSLDIGNNRFDELPDDVAELPELKQLDASGNDIADVTPRIGELDSLEQCDLSDNEIDSLPPEIADMESLEELDVSDNRLGDLPEGLDRTICDAEGNDGFTKLPQSMAPLANVLHECPPDEVLDSLAEAYGIYGSSGPVYVPADEDPCEVCLGMKEWLDVRDPYWEDSLDCGTVDTIPAAVTDTADTTSPADTTSSDTTVGDTTSRDTTVGDTASLDTSVVDTTGDESTTVDSSTVDSVASDPLDEDTVRADTSVIDTAAEDTAVVDSAGEDTTSDDGMVGDSAAEECIDPIAREEIDPRDKGGRKITICHVPPGEPENAHTIRVSIHALPAHMGHHEDYLGSCNCLSDRVSTWELDSMAIRALLDDNGLEELDVHDVVKAKNGRIFQLDLKERGISEFNSLVAIVDELEEIFLDNNRLSELPPELIELKKLKKLSVPKNRLKKVPDSVATFVEKFDSTWEESQNLSFRTLTVDTALWDTEQSGNSVVHEARLIDSASGSEVVLKAALPAAGRLTAGEEKPGHKPAKKKSVKVMDFLASAALDTAVVSAELTVSYTDEGVGEVEEGTLKVWRLNWSKSDTQTCIPTAEEAEIYPAYIKQDPRYAELLRDMLEEMSYRVTVPGVWEQVDAVIDTTANLITFSTDRLGTFGVFGDSTAATRLSHEANRPPSATGWRIEQGRGVVDIAYSLKREGEVRIRVFDLRGATVRDLVSGPRKAGCYRVVWRGESNSRRRVASTLYLMTMEAEDKRLVRRVDFVK